LLHEINMLPNLSRSKYFTFVLDAGCAMLNAGCSILVYPVSGI
jgi:hypothetical protein